ncbi:MAG: hypothetical protein PUD59_03320 [bacterium]|nr:hypothetical protein [bacterium]
MNGQKGGNKESIIKLFFSKGSKKKQTDEENLNDKQNEKKKQYFYTNSELLKKEQALEKHISLDLNLDEKKHYLDEEKNIEEYKTEDNENSEIKIEKKQTVNEYFIPTPIIDAEDNFEEITVLNEEKLQEIIIVQLEKMIKQDIKELEDFEYSIKILNEKEEDEVLLDETQKIKLEFKKLIDKFDKLKRKYFSSDEFNFIEIDDKIVEDLIVEYKDELKDKENVEIIKDDFKLINEYVSIIEKIVNIEKDKDEINLKIDEKLDKFEIRDEEFEKLKEDFVNIEEVNDFIDKFNRKQDTILNDLNEKIKKSENIQTRLETETSYITDFTKLIEAAIIVSLSKKIPRTFSGNILRTSLMLTAINSASKFIRKKETKKEIKTIKYTNYSKEIKNGIDLTKNMISQIDNSLVDIKDMKNKFKKEFSEYSSNIDEYKQLDKKLQELETELNNNKNIAKKYSERFEKTLKYNNQKVKKLEDMKNSA